jgi:hypothetical protein
VASRLHQSASLGAAVEVLSAIAFALRLASSDGVVAAVGAQGGAVIHSTTEAPEAVYEFAGPTEPMVVLSRVPFPDYGNRAQWQPRGKYRLDPTAPAGGTFAVVYRGDADAIVVEVFIRFHVDYLHALVLYPDGRRPRYFLKQRSDIGSGVVFAERPISPDWVPERLLPGFGGKRHTAARAVPSSTALPFAAGPGSKTSPASPGREP